MVKLSKNPHVVVIGGGFGGLAAAYQLTRTNIKVTLFEREDDLGGLAGSFPVNGERLEKFYHHWFTNDEYIMQLVKELKVDDRVVHKLTRTGMYFANDFFRLSSPLDVLKFSPLSLVNRLRLGLLVLHARQVGDWKALDAISAEEWLVNICGKEVYRVVWGPLLRGKFGRYASDVSAAWFWSKLKLRGGSRGRRGQEVLAYYRGGFCALAERIAKEIKSAGGDIITGAQVDSLLVNHGRISGVGALEKNWQADAVIATPALPIIADLLRDHVSTPYLDQLRSVKYLANICLVLELDRSLSETYWLNVNDPGFPFVGVIEHTNFEPAKTYGGRHIVYLSKYLEETNRIYQMNDKEFFNFSLPHIQRMFPKFQRKWILHYSVWRARHAQPVVVRNYSKRIPSVRTPLQGLYISTMAQVYPQDRGTNYAIRDGRRVARLVANDLNELLSK